MPLTEMIVGISAGLFMLVAFVAALRFLGTLARQATIRKAIDKDPAAIERLAEHLGEPESRPSEDDRTGVILIAIGVATVLASVTAGSVGGWTDYGIGAAMFPLVVGAAMWARHALVERARRREAGE